ncbi:MAG: RNA-binding S4 domain-containing protein [Hyphomicrobiaceae bacterium]
MGDDASQRLDKWIWYARLVKSRTLAARLVSEGKVRRNKERVSRASASVIPGDVLTIVLGPKVRILRIVAPGTRRGPASEARLLYEDLTPPEPAKVEQAATPPREHGEREHGSGRPTKRERRETDRLKGR